jgi:Spy/CpxP family protein refolding chaperone
MVAQIRKLRRIIVPALLCALAMTMVSCAAQQDARIVSDPDDHHDSAIPWNKQEQWETGGQFANMTDRR